MMRLAHLAVLGPGRDAAAIDFASGLNVVYGASDTGKSFLVSALDFMLGAHSGLKEIPERQGYDRIVLGVIFDTQSEFTLQRSVDGGNFRVHDGLTIEPKGKGTALSAKHSAKSTTNISRFLLSRIGLDGKIIRESKADVRSLSFRDLAPLALVTETRIIEEDSPVFSGQYTKATEELSVFKLILTGVDDSAFVAAKYALSAAETAKLRLDTVEELIGELRRQLPSDGDPEDDLSRIEAALEREQVRQHATEELLSQLNARRAELWASRETVERRQAEIDELIGRFALLDSHYQSDIARLTSIEESGTLLLQFPQRHCPLCGAEPAHQSTKSESCDGNVESVMAAARAEIQRIERLRTNLNETLLDLRSEKAALVSSRSDVERNVSDVQRQLAQYVTNEADSQRLRFSEVVERRAVLRQQTAVLARVRELEATRQELEATVTKPDEPKQETGISATAADQFSEAVRALLSAWHFPAPDRVHFERATADIVISGKPRSSYGKGLRAITHAAFTLALFDYCLTKGLAHPGFVVLDSPLLAYREPDPDSEGVRASDLKDRFYESVADVARRGQVIIIENEAPPSFLLDTIHSVHFSGNPSIGRYGLFPHAASR